MLHHLLCSARFSVRAAAVHRLHGGPHYNSREAWCITACICRWHAFVPALSSWRHSVSSHSAGTVHIRRRVTVGRTETQSSPARPLSARTTSWSWLSCSSWPCPFAGSNNFVRSQPRSTRLHHQPSTDFGNCGNASVHSTRSQQRRSSIHSCHHVSTYCNALLAGVLEVTTDKLQWVMNAAARVITGTHKFDRGLSRILHTELH